MKKRKPATPAIPATKEHDARRREEIRALMALLADARELQPVPAWFRQRALAAIRQRGERPARWAGFLRCVHDSLHLPASSLARGPAGPGRQLVFRGPDIELGLLLIPPSEESRGSLTGQVLLRADAAADMPGAATTAAPGGADAPSRAPAGRDHASALAIRIQDDRGRAVELAPDRFGIFSVAGEILLPLIITVRAGKRVEDAFISR